MSYKKECVFCKQAILMSQTLGKWFPVNLDNSPHMCREKKAAVLLVKIASKKTLTMEELDLRLKILESILLSPKK